MAIFQAMNEFQHLDEGFRLLSLPSLLDVPELRGEVDDDLLERGAF